MGELISTTCIPNEEKDRLEFILYFEGGKHTSFTITKKTLEIEPEKIVRDLVKLNNWLMKRLPE